MTVGAADCDDQLIGYSSEGPAALDEFKPDFCGVSNYAGYFNSDTGTSAACGVVAGVVALLKQAQPSLTQEVAKRLLKSTSKGMGVAGWDRHSGSGIIQAKAAYDNLKEQHSHHWGDFGRIAQLEDENRCLRGMYLEMALERQMLKKPRRNGRQL